VCLALFKPEKIKLSRGEMKTAFLNNPDGAGFATYDSSAGAVEIYKGYFTFPEFWDAYQTLTLGEKQKAMVHFRWTTHGATNYDNCHPFPLKDGALIHNGIIPLDETKGNNEWYMTGDSIHGMSDNRSDTRIFCEDYIDGMGAHELRLSRKLIESIIGWSKLVTMHDDGTVLIFNEQDGHWRSGVWYSNDSYKPYKVNKGTKHTSKISA
jgi:glutamine phosphoribosylpyrophosphate amidotransferase